jgi:hypothetical protein
MEQVLNFHEAFFSLKFSENYYYYYYYYYTVFRLLINIRLTLEEHDVSEAKPVSETSCSKHCYHHTCHLVVQSAAERMKTSKSVDWCSTCLYICLCRPNDRWPWIRCPSVLCLRTGTVSLFALRAASRVLQLIYAFLPLLMTFKCLKAKRWATECSTFFLLPLNSSGESVVQSGTHHASLFGFYHRFLKQ